MAVPTLSERRDRILEALAEAEESGGVVSYTTEDGRSISVDLPWLQGQLERIESALSRRRFGRRSVARFSRPG